MRLEEYKKRNFSVTFEARTDTAFPSRQQPDCKDQEFRDEYRENVKRLIEQKRKGQKVTPIEQPRKAPVIDLMEALKRSLKSSSGSSKESGTSGKSRKKASGRRKAA